jgi:hypothetical protein
MYNQTERVFVKLELTTRNNKAHTIMQYLLQNMQLWTDLGYKTQLYLNIPPLTER